MKRTNLSVLLAIFLIAIALLSRIVNAGLKLDNFVPIAAIGVFSGAVIKDRRALALLVPILGQFLADVYFQLFTDIRGFYPGIMFNYGALVLATLLGMTMKEPKPARSIFYILGGSVVFFLVSNFGYFASGWNGYTIAGLEKTYIDAIPFFKNTFFGDIAGGVLFFGGYFLVQARLLSKAEKAKA